VAVNPVIPNAPRKRLGDTPGISGIAVNGMDAEATA
jgi:hypothetical protein